MMVAVFVSWNMSHLHGTKCSDLCLWWLWCQMILQNDDIKTWSLLMYWWPVIFVPIRKSFLLCYSPLETLRDHSSLSYLCLTFGLLWYSWLVLQLSPQKRSKKWAFELSISNSGQFSTQKCDLIFCHLVRFYELFWTVSEFTANQSKHD